MPQLKIVVPPTRNKSSTTPAGWGQVILHALLYLLFATMILNPVIDATTRNFMVSALRSMKQEYFTLSKDKPPVVDNGKPVGPLPSTNSPNGVTYDFNRQR